MIRTFVLRDLVRNPRRTLSTMVGIVLGVGLFCGVLFFVDGLSASMTQRAVAPLQIDMQRIVTQRAGLEFTQTVEPAAADAGQVVTVTLVIRNPGSTDANEVTVRSVANTDLTFVPASGTVDGAPIGQPGDNPFASGDARVGHNLGTLRPGDARRLSYRATAAGPIPNIEAAIASAYSTRESVNPVAADQPPSVALDELADQIAQVPGVAHAAPLSLADLGLGTIRSDVGTVPGPAKLFGTAPEDAARDSGISLVDGAFTRDGAVVSVEAAGASQLMVGDVVTVDLPDGSSVELPVAGIADLSRARSLFSSRRGGDLETFIYVPNAVVISPASFATAVAPAFDRAAAAGDGRLKAPPIREVDITLDRGLLDANPASAVAQTERIAADVMAIADQQGYLLDNITNTLHVATDDAAVAKRLFVFLGVPGALLAAMLSAYAGNVLAEAQRREHAMLRIRGASRRHLRRMLAIRTALLTAAGSIIGLASGYVVALAILGRASLSRASLGSITTSAVIGTLGGFVATGAALYVTARRKIDREINEDRAELSTRQPVWRRFGADIIGIVIIAVGTAWAVRTHAFDGAAGSVYFGRSVQLNLVLLVLPVAVWITGGLLAARLIGSGLHRLRPASSPDLAPLGRSLLLRSLSRRPWAIGNGAFIAALIVALATCLAAFTSSYDAAKLLDARYANGADIRVTPTPLSAGRYTVARTSGFETPSVERATPVIAGLSNVILRSDRTSDPANLVALDPATYPEVAPVEPLLTQALAGLQVDRDRILVSRDMAAFLQVDVGDQLHVLLARATPDQTESTFTISALFERLAGFPDGADAIIDIGAHIDHVPAKQPDFFLASTSDGRDATLTTAVVELTADPATADLLQVDTRMTTLDRDQSSLAALNIAGLVDLDSAFALAMTVVTIAIFVFGLLLQRRREYVTLRAQGLEPRTIRLLIGAEAAAVAVTGTAAGLLVGAAMGYYFVAVLRPLFVLDPPYRLPLAQLLLPVALVGIATLASVIAGSRLVNSLEPTELLRDE